MSKWLSTVAALVFLLIVAPASAQSVTIAWDHTGGGASRFDLSKDDGKTWVYDLGLPVKTVQGDTIVYEKAIPAITGDILRVRACNEAVCAVGTNSVTVGAIEPPPPDPCATLTNLPSVFVTRWEHTTGMPGSRFRLNFQLSSASPITNVEARIAGKTAATITGADLRESGGIWLTTPASGSYQVSIWAKNSTGCTREAAALVNLVVK